MIVHICGAGEWAEAKRAGAVRAASLEEVGFTHCSDPGTVHLPANLLYRGRTDLVLLEIDPAALGAPVRWEPADPPIPGGPWFPHVYGPIEAAAVVAVHEFPPGSDGEFSPPPTLARR
ncbi:DUF952 domain-containing protein [Sciscionella sediminilitoris]|uniref:DUF952 domain-containing protein n=1 Tax=Sciscionella sediminilitoris TaxID=1445613 RepID=UPI0004DEF5A5|nr:DUF952 domain-containing protein [Sciscionella sp. SE31]